MERRGGVLVSCVNTWNEHLQQGLWYYLCMPCESPLGSTAGGYIFVCVCVCVSSGRADQAGPDIGQSGGGVKHG